ncbi:hypothetical protein HDU67_004292, partial [Dinochytrium kinnereticum]
VGGVGVAGVLDGVEVGEVAVSPVSIAGGEAPLGVEVSARLVTGVEGGVDDKIAAVVRGILSSPVSLTTRVSVTRFVLGGQGMLPIDQFANVTITVPSSLVSSLLPTSLEKGEGGIFSFNKASFLDLSNILPTPEKLDALSVTIRSIDIETLPNAEIVMGVQMEYFNPLGISLTLPYGGASIGIGPSSSRITVDVSSVSLRSGAGSTSTSIRVKLPPPDEVMQNAIAAIIRSILSTGKIGPDAILVGEGLSFGGSMTDRSRLLMKVSVDVAPFLRDVDVGRLIGTLISKILPFPLPTTLETLQTFAKDALSTSSGLIRVTTLPGKRVEMVVPEFVVRLPFVVTAKIGFARVFVGVNEHPLVEIGVGGLVATGDGEGRTRVVVPGVLVAFGDDERTREDVAAVLGAFLGGKD